MSAAAGDLLQKVGLASATTLDSNYTINDTTVTVASTAGWPSDTGVTFAIDVIDSQGVQVPGTYNEYVGTVATGTSISNVDWADGNADRNYTAGATTRVYIPVSKTRENRIVTWGLVHGNQDGTLKTDVAVTTANATLTSPKVITGINDTNGNELLKVTATASAVNELTLANAATGNAPSVSATGSDTNIDLYLLGKGTGSARFAGPHDGWIACNETLTYASSTTFTCSSALAGVLSTGDKIKFTQTTAKYFYVTGVSGTTVTVTGGSNYTVANAAITLPFYSKAATPLDFPTWFSWTPTITSSGGGSPALGNGTYACKYTQIGKTVTCRFGLTLGSTTTFGTGVIRFSVPVTPANSGKVGVGVAYMEDSGVQAYLGNVELVPAGSYIEFSYASTSASGRSVYVSGSLTQPFAWGTGDYINATFTYEAA